MYGMDTSGHEETDNECVRMHHNHGENETANKDEHSFKLAYERA